MGTTSLVVRGLLSVTLLFMLSLIAAAGWKVIESVYKMTDSTALGNADGIMLMGSITLIGLLLVVILWWWITPLKTDVRQSAR